MLKKMNLPNKLTMLRILLVPLFVIAMCIPIDWMKWVAFGIFAVAAITDFVDGYISRKYNLVTNFGKIMDPLADKLLISAGFIMLTGTGSIPAYITAIIILRDFFANSIRMFGADDKSVVAAVLSGKIKTAFQLLAVSFGLVDIAINTVSGFGSFILNSMKMDVLGLFVNVFMTVCVAGAVIATLWSLVDYIVKFKKHINIEK